MTEITCTYHGNGKTLLKHSGNGATIESDLPKEVGGDGRLFCPGDMFVGSVAACLLATVGEMAEHRGKSIGETNVTAQAEFSGKPQHVTKLSLQFSFDESIDAADRQKYLAVVKVCPVRNSIDKEIEVVLTSN